MKQNTKTSALSLRLKSQIFLLKILPVCLFFSYSPKIVLAKTDSMNLEFSLPLLWLMLFALLSLPSVFQVLRNAFLNPKQKVSFALFLSSSFPLYSLLSILWSKNQLRAILTSGIIWCLYFSLLTFPKIILLHRKQLGKQIEQNLLLSAVIVSIFCWLQSILDLLGFSQSNTLLCDGCISKIFGFPHPNGFAIEPQFMGNLLLAPIFVSLFRLFQHYEKSSRPFSKTQPATVRNSSISTSLIQIFSQARLFIHFRLAVPLFLIATLYLTFSRGAIFSFWFGLILLSLFSIIYSRKSGKTIQPQKLVKPYSPRKLTVLLFAVAVIPFLFTLFSQGLFTALGPTRHSFLDGIATSINHLSLGSLKLDSPTPNQPPAESPSSSPPDSATQPPTSKQQEPSPGSPKPAPTFSGYIKESTHIRLNLNHLALTSWQSSFGRALLGVGLGGTGPSLYQEFPELGSPKEIIQNEYFAVLYELGLIGVITIVITSLNIYILYHKNYKKAKKPTKQPTSRPIGFMILNSFMDRPRAFYLSTLIISYGFTLCFFSGLPNALHIYLLPPLLFLSQDHNTPR